MSKHTPSPWQYSEDLDGHVIRMSSALDSRARYRAHHIIEYSHMVEPEDGNGSQFKEAEANARLIASAPDLYGNAVRVRDYVRAYLIDNDFDDEAVSALECIEKLLVDALEPLEPDQGFWNA